MPLRTCFQISYSYPDSSSVESSHKQGILKLTKHFLLPEMLIRAVYFKKVGDLLKLFCNKLQIVNGKESVLEGF